MVISIMRLSNITLSCHIYDNIDRLCAAMLKAGAHIEDFENIYVLGHSFADAPDGVCHLPGSVPNLCSLKRK